MLSCVCCRQFSARRSGVGRHGIVDKHQLLAWLVGGFVNWSLRARSWLGLAALAEGPVEVEGEDPATRVASVILGARQSGTGENWVAGDEAGAGLERQSAARYAWLLQRCGNARALLEGKLIHADIIKNGFARDTFLGNHLVQMYGKCGSMEDACSVFESLFSPNVFSWTIMIGACVENGLAREALQLFWRMDQEGVKLDKITFINAISLCSSLGSLAEGKALHARIVATGFDSNDVVGNALLNMYCKAGSLKDARNVFESLQAQTVVSWTALIAGHALHGHSSLAFELFRHMIAEGVKPNEVTFMSLLGTCASVGALKEGKAIHALVLASEFSSHVSVATALIDMYGKCGRPELACTVFGQMEHRDAVAWNAMIAVCAQHGRDRDALHLFEQMDLEGQTPDDVTFIAVLDACSNLRALALGQKIHEFILDSGLESAVNIRNSLVNMYGKCGSLEEAKDLFDKMNSRTVITWSAMIAAYAQNGYGKDALCLYEKMELQGVKADEYTFTSILDACSTAGALSKGREIHKSIEAAGLDTHLVIGTALINMYGKCGQAEVAQRVFKRMRQKNLVSWSALIASYAQHGDQEAIEFFREMHLESVKADDVVFLSLLHGCSHAGLLKDAWVCFLSMIGDYKIQPGADHYGCMVDLLGRSGRLADAEDLIHNMPYQPNAVAFKTLLAACKIHGDMSRGARIAQLVSGLKPADAAPYLLMSQMYAGAGKWEEMVEVRRSMTNKGVKKEKGWSCIEVKNRVHEFMAGDSSHPQDEEIRAELQKLNSQMKQLGYVPDTREVAHDVEEEDKERMLSCHSEKLAIALGLISTPPGTPLHLVKNLRVCSDCHTVSKLVSKIAGRRIVVRDANRFHRFEHGVCSCGDYW